MPENNYANGGTEKKGDNYKVPKVYVDAEAAEDIEEVIETVLDEKSKDA